MGELIKLALSNFPLTAFILGLLSAGVSLALYARTQSLTQAVVMERVFAYFMLFAVGIAYLYNFVIHVFFAEMAAHFIGWPNSPFQYEVGFASLGFGIVGVLAFRQSWSFRAAAITGPAFFTWGAAGGHVYQILAHHNFAPGNAGVVLWTDIFLPVVAYGLLYWQYRVMKSQSA